MNDRDHNRDLLTRRVGRHLKAARERKQLSQAGLAHVLLEDQNTISRWERGVQMPRPQSLLVLSKALGVNVASLFEPFEDERPNGDDHQAETAA